MKKIFSLKGFTTLELVIALAIIFILAAIAIPSYLNQRENSKISRAIGEIQYISKRILQYYLDNNAYPPSLAEVGLAGLKDPWGNVYQYWPITGDKKQKVRKDRNLHPINTDYDLCSKGKDGQTNYPLTAGASQDDIVRANNGAFIGLGSKY